MKKHDVNYHDYDNSISFYFDHCNHLNIFNRLYLNKSVQNKRIFSHQSEIIENKKIKFFLEKNLEFKTMLRRSTNQSVQFIVKRLIKSQKKLKERRRTHKSWRKELRKIDISASRILSSMMNIQFRRESLMMNRQMKRVLLKFIQ
jgi:hypothetical protein